GAGGRRAGRRARQRRRHADGGGGRRRLGHRRGLEGAWCRQPPRDASRTPHMSLTKEGSHPQKMRDGKKIAGWWSGVAPLRKGLGTTLWALSFVAALSLLGCEGSSADEVSIRDDMPYGLRDCPRPAEGCACDPGTPPVDCYVSRGGRCGKGAMYYRDGLFTACLDVEDVGLRPRTGFIAPGFSKCLSGCGPDCF